MSAASPDTSAPLIIGQMRATYDQTLVDHNLFELFQRHVERVPDKEAVLALDGSSLTFAELAARARRVSAFLRSRELDDEVPVGVFMSRTPDVVAVLLGILHAGGTYVPLDPAEPAERARHLAMRACLPLVLGDAPMLNAFRRAVNTSEVDPTFEIVDVADVFASEHLDEEAPCATGGPRRAYIMFTSGSTGAPKGVEVEHRNVINLLLSAAQAFEFSDADRYLAVSTLAFDISVAEVFLPLIFGASVVMGDRVLLLTRGAVANAIEHHNVTVFQTGPSVWALLLEGGRPFPHLRVAVTTGESCAPTLARRVSTVADLVWNLYGPTETTIWCTGQLISAPGGLDECTEIAAPVGHPWPNMPAVILNDAGQPVAPGEQGDLWVTGLAVTRGYQDTPELTAERYITRPDGRRYYKTGDLISQGAEGVLRFHGRNDDQIQVHGVRIEPMEVESVVREDPSVAHAAATWFLNSGAQALVVGVVTKPNAPTTTAALHERLAAKLPGAMVPSRIVLYDALPLTPNGKTDRLAIRADAVRDEANSTPVPDHEELSPTQSTLRRIWAATLRRSSISLDDSFFALGGDSLAAVTMTLDAEDEFDVTIPVQLAMRRPTLRAFAAEIDGLLRSGPTSVESNASVENFTVGLVSSGSKSPVFFSAAEMNLAHEGVWRLDCPLYAVNYWTLGSGFSRAKSLEALSRSHVAEIKRVQPVGPYRIAGYSFGGIIALEIVHQLTAAGDEVELLFLLDPTRPYRTFAAPDVERADDVPQRLAAARASKERLHHKVIRHLQQAAKDPKSELPDLLEKLRIAPFALLLSRETSPWLQYRLLDLYGRRPNALTAKLLPKDRWIGFWYVAKRLASVYVAQPYHGPVLGVFLTGHLSRAAWEPLLSGNAEIHDVDATHADLVQEPVLATWMDLLAARLEA